MEMQIMFLQLCNSGKKFTGNGCASQIMQNSFLKMFCDFQGIWQISSFLFFQL